MNQPWLYRFGMWLCEKTGHLGARSGWIYNGHFHRDCKICGRIVSEPIKEEITMDEGYHCVICGRFLPADEGGVIVHDDIPHPPDMTFDEEENTQ